MRNFLAGLILGIIFTYFYNRKDKKVYSVHMTPACSRADRAWIYPQEDTTSWSSYDGWTLDNINN